jgi:ribosomal protein S18 acetylase RimI-like enzyme
MMGVIFGYMKYKYTILNFKFQIFAPIMHITKVNSDELSKIQTMANVIWNQHYPSIIGQEQVDYMLDRMYDLNSLQKQLQEGHIFFLAEELGFISIVEQAGVEQPEVEQPNSWFLNKLYVMPDAQRLGVGKKLLEFVQDKYGIELLRLQVNRQNYKAINFYFKNGFEIERVADFNIGNGFQMNDFIMVWKK